MRIYSHYAHESKQEEVFEKIAEVVEQAQTGESETTDVLLTEEETVLAEYGELYLQNTDMVGWLSIAGTNINYPVMQTPNNPNYYLKHNFEKEYSDLGTPYVQENCDLFTSDNLVIYGHHIKGQKMFGALENYKSKDFYEEHKTIRFDTLTKRGEYEIIAVFKTVAYSSAGFRYYDFINAEDENDFNAYIAKCKELALYDTGVTAEYGDRLITLSTCECGNGYKSNTGFTDRCIGTYAIASGAQSGSVPSLQPQFLLSSIGAVLLCNHIIWRYCRRC